MNDLPGSLPELTQAIMQLRKKPGTQAQYKRYPLLLQQFNVLLEQCDEAKTLKDVLRIDTGYFLPPNYRQRLIEKLLTMERTPQLLRLYAMQLELFGDVDEFGNEDLNIDARVESLHAEADALDQA